MAYTLIHNASVVNEGTICKASVVIENDTIYGIYHVTEEPKFDFSNKIDATDLFLLPGVIDDHVHFREPGLTHKANIYSESRAAVAGGVTTIFDMPNCIPQTTTVQALEEKFSIAQKSCATNYSFYIGATKTNLSEIEAIDPNSICGIKLFMGSSTGGMLVDDAKSIRQLFSVAKMPVAAHCEDTDIINRNANIVKMKVGDSPVIHYHPVIRNQEACYASTAKAIDIAAGTDVKLHILHLSTAKELQLFSKQPLSDKRITAEACIAHLVFSFEDYETLGAKIKCNPSIKHRDDRFALRAALTDGTIDIVGTDHAPHLLKEKEGGALTATSGMPTHPYSLISMLDLADQGVLKLTDIVKLMCHNPAELFGICKRGFIRTGYKADLVLVSKCSTENPNIADSHLNMCGWNPLEGKSFGWNIHSTFVNGQIAYNEGKISDNVFGERVLFCNRNS